MPQVVHEASRCNYQLSTLSYDTGPIHRRVGDGIFQLERHEFEESVACRKEILHGDGVANHLDSNTVF